MSAALGFVQVLALFLMVKILARVTYTRKEGVCTVVIGLCAYPFFGAIEYWATLILTIIYAISVCIKNRRPVFSITIVLVTIIMGVLADSIINFVLIESSGKNYQILFANPLWALLYSILIFIFLILSALGIRKLLDLIHIDHYVAYKKYGYMFLGSVSLVSLVSYLMIYYGSLKGFNNQTILVNAVTFGICVLVLTLVGLIFFRIVVGELQIDNQKIQMQRLKEYVTKIEGLYKDLRSFRHDYVNVLSSLYSFVENKDMPGLKEFLEGNILSLNGNYTLDPDKIAFLRNIKLTPFKGLLAVKLIYAQEKNIKVEVEVVEEIERIDMNSIDLCRVAGVLLDNAIEAAMESTDKILNVAIIKKETGVLMVFANSLKDSGPPLFKMYEDGYSTKIGDTRGIGLANLRGIINRYNNITIDTLIRNSFLIQELEINKKGD